MKSIYVEMTRILYDNTSEGIKKALFYQHIKSKEGIGNYKLLDYKIVENEFDEYGIVRYLVNYENNSI